MAGKKKFENTLKVMRFSLLLSGIKTSKTSWNYIIEIFVNSFLYYTNLVILYTVVFGEVAWLVNGVNINLSFIEMSLLLPLITITVLGTIKSFNLYLKRDIVCEIIDLLTDIHPEEKSKEDFEYTGEIDQETEENKITNESVKVLNIMINLLIAVSWSVLIMFCLLPITVMGFEYFTKGKTGIIYPYTVLYWFDVYKTKLWPVLYLHQVLATTIVCINLYGSEILFYVICAYVEMHFRILCHRFESTQLKSTEQIKRDIVQSVLKHQQLIYLVDQAEKLFSKPVLFQIVSSSFLICLSAFNITATEDMKTLFAFATFLLLSLSQVFLLCFFGDKLMASSTTVTEAVYKCPWYTFNVATKKAVLVIMIRARKPCRFTAANFADLNLKTFATILSRSWSYFALLKTIYK